MSLISGKLMSLISGKHMSLISGKHINVQACYITYLLILFVPEGTSGRKACYMDYLNCVDIVVCVILLKEVLKVFLSYIVLFKPRG